jgi:hypothetical protein
MIRFLDLPSSTPSSTKPKLTSAERRARQTNARPKPGSIGGHAAAGLVRAAEATPQRDAGFIASYRAGEEVAVIAARAGISPEVVSKALKAANVPLRRGVWPAASATWVQRYAAGETTEQIAAAAGVAGKTVSRFMRERGVTIRSRGTSRPDLFLMRDTLAARFAAGEAIAAIAASFNTTRTTIKAHLRKAGVTVQPGPKARRPAAAGAEHD